MSDRDKSADRHCTCTCLPGTRRRNCPVHGEGYNCPVHSEGYAAGDVFAQELADTRDTERAKWRRDHPERYR